MVQVPGIIDFDLLYPIFNTFLDKGEDCIQGYFFSSCNFRPSTLKNSFRPILNLPKHSCV